MRLRAILFAFVVLAGVAAGAWRLAGAAAAWVERTTGARVHAALDAAGLEWVGVDLGGLTVTLTGAAPDETSRFRALEIVRQVVDARRIADATTVRAAEQLAPAPFALELLRNEAEVSLIGLVPEAGGRDVIGAALGAGGLTEHVTDMLDSASDPAPEGWREALGFALAVLAELPRAKISVQPGSVAVIAVADSDPDRASLEERLRKAAPAEVALALDISAPRPVLAPFAVDFRLAGGAARLATCSADSPEGAAEILEAAGLSSAADCAIGLGSPSPEWTAAVLHGIDAVRDLGGGGFALRDLEAELTGPEGITPEMLTAVSARLDAALPEAFRLRTVMPPRTLPQSDGAQIYTPRFEAVLAADGSVRLTGAVQDATSRAAIDSYAAALFGHERVTNATVVDPRLPEGWPGRVLAGIGALAGLKEGKVTVTPERVAVEGWGIEPDIDEKVAALLAAKVGDAALVDVAFNAEAAAAAADAARPKPEVCADQIAAILEAGSIEFAAGSTDIVPASRGIIAAIADVLRGCPGAAFEIGGHTDSQGSAQANQQLSEDRARAVLEALDALDLPLAQLTARGYGATEPVADNATEAGRARNRRIAFTLITPEVAAAAEAAEAAAAAAAAAPAAAGACAEGIAAILAQNSIQFAPGSSTIAAESEPVIAEIGGELRDCPEAAFEIGGHTDSEGSESGNQRLSQQRAEAVLAALRSDDLPLSGVTARGYGESQPVADNAAPEGRARNRRIAFTLVGPQPVAEGDADEPGTVTDTLCAERITGILEDDTIQFAAGSADIAPESGPVVAAVQTVLRTCPEAALEIGGHTDSEGSESGNQRLSQQRAEAVLAALRADDLPLPGVTARGYGESQPVADNATAEGRAQNRRFAVTAAAAAEDAVAGNAEAPGEPE